MYRTQFSSLKMTIKVFQRKVSSQMHISHDIMENKIRVEYFNCGLKATTTMCIVALGNNAVFNEMHGISEHRSVQNCKQKCVPTMALLHKQLPFHITPSFVTNTQSKLCVYKIVATKTM